MTYDPSDEQWAAEYSGLTPTEREALIRGQQIPDEDTDRDMADYYSDRFQHPDGPADYTITVSLSGGDRTYARLLAMQVADVVRRNEERVNCPVCGGSRWVGSWRAEQGRPSPQARRCTACKDGTVLAGPAAVVTFESPAEVGAEATPEPKFYASKSEAILADVLAPHYFRESERAAQDARFLASVRAHPSQAGKS